MICGNWAGGDHWVKASKIVEGVPCRFELYRDICLKTEESRLTAGQVSRVSGHYTLRPVATNSVNSVSVLRAFVDALEPCSVQCSGPEPC
jgi:hypothetical protein